MNCRPAHILGSLLLLTALYIPLQAQQVDVANMRNVFKENKWLTVNGGVSANTVFYTGTDGQNRQPFTYALAGNLNANIYGLIDLPFSFTLTNLNTDYAYPALPNRFALHPTYKWITGHFGDVAMVFSPYTLNGHQFTGAGVDLALEKLSVSVMGGRLLKAVPADSAMMTPPIYERWGYGAKMRYTHQTFYAGVSFLGAFDNVNSIPQPVDSLGVALPKDNKAASIEFGLNMIENVALTGEYGISLLNHNAGQPENAYDVYHAIRLNVTAQISQNTIGIGYERIDPGYATLGAYYFNNDYENFTLNYARTFFDNKLNVAANAGVQRDDLAAKKEQSETRFVASANVNYVPGEQLNMTLSYSGFQTYKNIKSQFDYVNELTPYDNLDTLDFKQISQNLSLNAMYTFGSNEAKKQTLTATISYQESADKQGELVKTGSLLRFLNFSGMYNLMLAPSGLSFSAVLNTSYSYAAGISSLVIGPTLSASAKFPGNKLSSGLALSYNMSRTGNVTSAGVFNLRGNAGYVFLKRHNFTANLIFQHRGAGGTQPSRQSFTATIAYAFNF